MADRLGVEFFIDNSALTQRDSVTETPRTYELAKLKVRASLQQAKKPTGQLHILAKAVNHLRGKFGQSSNGYKTVSEKFFHFDPSILKIDTSCILAGYWQSEKYFQSSRSKIIEDFRPKEVMNSVNRFTAESIDSTNSVSIHVRRGDYVTNSQANKFHGLCGLDYYEKAIEFIQKRASNTHFFIFSDELDWVKENLRINAPTSYISANTGGESYWDMQLMKECRHHIVANSSFSWWGAWLSENQDGMVIAPDKWFSDPSINTKDLIPSRWVRL